MTNLSFQFDVCENRHGGNAESAAAHGGIDRCLLRERVLEFLYNRGPLGATADEACDSMGMFHNSIAPRISELKCLGQVYATTMTRPTRLGRRARVYCATEVKR